MYRKKTKRCLSFLMMLVMALSLFTMKAWAAAETTVKDGKIKVTSTRGTVTSSDDTTVTITIAVSGINLGTEYTQTVVNNCGKKAELTFDYNFNNFDWTGPLSANKCYVGDVAITDSNKTGTYGPIELEAEASVTLKTYIKCGSGGQTGTLTLSNFVFKEAQDTSKVTFSFDSAGGTMTAGETPVTSGSSQDVSLESGVALTATANSGYTFLGWIDSDGHIKSTDASFTYKPTVDVTITPVFASTSGTGTAWFLAGGLYLYNDLNAAGTKAASLTDKTVILMNNGTLQAGTYTIPSGVTFLVPFDSSNTLYRYEPGYTSSYTTPKAYRTLTMAKGANIVVNGEMSLSCKHRYGTASANGTSAPSGDCSFVKMAEGSNITVNNGAALYAWGFITGTDSSSRGTVTINTGAKVYEYFQFQDYRGGQQTMGMENGVFPLSQYYIQNIEVPMTVYAGAYEYCYATVSVSVLGEVGMPVIFIGGSDAMFNLSDGYVVKQYKDGRLVVDIYGTLDISPTEITIGEGLLQYPLDTTGYELPINGYITVTLKNGSSLKFSQDVALLPGTELIIESGANCTVGSGTSVYVYDIDQWGNYCSSSDFRFKGVAYAPGGASDVDHGDATVVVNGTVDASAGYLYTTAGGANVYSTEKGCVKTKAGSQTVTYQLLQKSSEYVEIDITPAKLKNEDGTYVETATATTTTTYNYDHHTCEHESGTTTVAHGKWHAGEHTVTSVVTAPTCTEAGYTTHTCACDHSYTTDEVAAAGHKWSGGSCTVCGATRPAVAQIGTELYYTLADAVEAYNTDSGYIQMLLDSSDETTISKTVYLDLNGCDVSGVSVDSDDGTLYGMDSKTDGYESGKEGSITLSSGTVAPVTDFDGKNTTEGSYTVNTHRYLAVKAENVDSWSFHRYNLSVGEAYYLEVLSNNTAKIGVSAYFRGNSTVRAKLSEMGFSFDEATPVTTALSNPADPYTLYYTSGAATMTAADLKLRVRAAVLFSTDTNYYYSNSWTVDFVTLLQTYYQDADANAKAILESFATVAEIQLT